MNATKPLVFAVLLLLRALAPAAAQATEPAAAPVLPIQAMNTIVVKTSDPQDVELAKMVQLLRADTIAIATLNLNRGTLSTEPLVRADVPTRCRIEVEAERGQVVIRAWWMLANLVAPVVDAEDGDPVWLEQVRALAQRYPGALDIKYERRGPRPHPRRFR